MSVRFVRGWNSLITLLVVVALVLQVWLAIRASATPPGHAVGTLRGAWVGTRVLRVFSFFTIQSNVLAAVTSAQVARNPHRDGPIWRAVRLASLFGITVTGIVYSTVLAKVHEPHGWQETLSNNVFHYIVPIMMVLGWFLFGPRPRIEPRTIARAAVWPAAWIAYILIFGAISKWYPYPFLDVTTHGLGRVIANAFAVIVVLMLVTCVYWFFDSRLPAAETEPAAVDSSGPGSKPDR
jgi:hypothetical protein